MKILTSLAILFTLLFTCCIAMSAGIHIGPGQTYANIQSASSAVQAGDTVYVHAGSYAGSQFVSDLKGTPSEWIVISRYQNDVIDISGKWQFSKCEYIKFEYLTFKANVTYPGRLLLVDNNGDCATQSHHITVDSCYFSDVSDPYPFSALKFAGVDTFEVKNCVFKNITPEAMSFNACHVGNITGNWIEDCGLGGHIKGGATFITMERNIFLNASVSPYTAFEFGGETGPQFYCPGSTAEVSDLKFYSNLVIGGYRGFALSSAVNCEVVNNTFYECGDATMRFLTTSSLYPTMSGNKIQNNIFAFGSASQYFNGSSQPAVAASFSKNIYYSSVNTAFNGPYWDSPALDLIKDTNPIIYGANTPMFVNGANNDFYLNTSSPAIAAGITVTNPVVDFYGYLYNSPRSIGAVEYGFPAEINDLSANGKEINVYPNPATEKLTIDFLKNTTEQIDLKIFNVFGQLVFTQNISNNTEATTLDISQFGEGIYFVRMTLDNQTFYDKKIIITR